MDGVLSTPLDARPPFPGAVVCHGHPLFGGSMDSLLTYAICEALAENGIATLRFNFRPFGQGATEEGGTACQDVAAGLNLLRNWHDVRRNRYGMVGYSAGAAAILRGLGQLKRARALSFISPPLSALETTGIGRDKRPRQFVIGAADRIVDPAKLRRGGRGNETAGGPAGNPGRRSHYWRQRARGSNSGWPVYGNATQALAVG